MIIDIKGKHFVFGMHWQLLIGQGTPASLAAQVARSRKTDIWHDGVSRLVGALTQADARLKLQGQVHSAAIALTRIERLGQNFIFVYAEKSVFFVCGIVRGRPRLDYDLVLTSQDDVAAAVAKFATFFTEPFVVAGNVDGVRDLFRADRGVRTEDVALAELARVADDATAIRRPHRIDWARMSARAVMAISVVCGAGLAAYRASPQSFDGLFGEKKVEKTDDQRYAEVLNQQLSTPVYKPAALTNWLAWWTTQPVVVGGWMETHVECKQLPRCDLIFEPKAPFATNRTFEDAKPADWPTPQFTADGLKLTVHLLVPKLPVTLMQSIVAHLPAANTVNLELGSQLQSVRRISQSTSLLAPSLFGQQPGLIGSNLHNAVWQRTWKFVGPLRDSDLIAQLPAYTTLESIELTVNVGANPTKINSKLDLTASGQAFQRTR
jgi:hypothetical protein